MKLLTGVLLTAVTALAQSSNQLPVIDAGKIADALRAGPHSSPKMRHWLDWPAAPGGEYRVLRKGSNEWTCLPGIQGFNRDPSNGMPYVTHLPNHTELYLVMPVRQWNEQHVHE